MLNVKDLRKYYGKTTALSGISFHISKNETTAFFGPDGSGKTTLLDILSGYLLRYRGLVEYTGFRDQEPGTYSKKASYIPAKIVLYQEMKASDYLEYIYGINRGKRNLNSEIRKMSELEEAGITSFLGREISDLNLLEKKEMMIAAELLARPSVLLIDDPFEGLRSDEIDRMSLFLRSIQDKTTLIMASDRLMGFSDLCRQTIVLNKGKIVSSKDENLFMHRKHTNSIRLKVFSSPEDIRSAFQFVPGIGEIDFQMSSERNLLEVVLYVDTEDDIRREIWNAAVNFNIPIYEMRTMQVSPEELYLQMTGN